MARPEEGGEKSLGEWLSIPGHSEQLAQAFAATKYSAIKMADLTTPVRTKTIEKKDSSPCILDLPLRKVVQKKAQVYGI